MFLESNENARGAAVVVAAARLCCRSDRALGRTCQRSNVYNFESAVALGFGFRLYPLGSLGKTDSTFLLVGKGAAYYAKTPLGKATVSAKPQFRLGIESPRKTPASTDAAALAEASKQKRPRRWGRWGRWL
jgi:hypothetical protein